MADHVGESHERDIKCTGDTCRRLGPRRARGTLALVAAFAIAYLLAEEEGARLGFDSFNPRLRTY